MIPAFLSCLYLKGEVPVKTFIELCIWYCAFKKATCCGSICAWDVHLHDFALCGFRSISEAETVIDQKSEIDGVMHLHHPCDGERLINVT